jgi:hypothetical protein
MLRAQLEALLRVQLELMIDGIVTVNDRRWLKLPQSAFQEKKEPVVIWSSIHQLCGSG